MFWSVVANESSLQTMLAAHLFGPLMTGSKVLDEIECPNPDCMAKVKITNISFGNCKAWYMVWHYNVVKLEKAEPEEMYVHRGNIRNQLRTRN